MTGEGHGRGGHGDEAWAGSGRVLACGMEVQVRRWWDPCPVFGPLSRARLEHGLAALARVYSAADGRPGLEGHDGPAALAACCAAGNLAGAVELAESLVGLGPGLAPSGDSMISGLLLALRLLGGATAGGTRAVWLADWLGAAVTCYAEQRTTALGAALLHCAARGQAAEEVSAVLRGFAGQEPVEPAARRLLAAGGESGAELTWGLMAGCGAALAPAVSCGSVSASGARQRPGRCQDDNYDASHSLSGPPTPAPRRAPGVRERVSRSPAGSTSFPPGTTAP